MLKRLATLLAFSGTAATFLSQTTVANTILDLTSTVINNGSASSENYSVIASGLAANGIISPTITFSLGDAFNGGGASGQLSTASDFGASATGSGAPWNFEDSFAFSTTGASIYTATIGLPTSMTTGLTDLQVRLISATEPDGVTPVPITTNTNAAGQVLVSGAGVVTLVDGWTNLTLGATSYSATMPTDFAAGNYILQVRGEAASGGGSYGGTIAFSPVPLPAALPLLLTGLGGLGIAFRRRSRY